MDQVGSDGHHHSEKDAASLEKSLLPHQERCCSALPVAGSRDCCYEHSPKPSEVLRKGQQG